MGGEFIPDDGVGLDANNVADAFSIKPLEPFFAPEFTIHGEDKDVFGSEYFKKFGDKFNAMTCVRISTLGGLWKNSPGDRDGNIFNYYSDS